MTPTPAPPARVHHPLAYLGGDQVLLFGGLSGPYYGDTWVYDLSANTWTQSSPTPSPSARYLHALAPLGEGQALLFGGWDAGGYDAETWLANGFDPTVVTLLSFNAAAEGTAIRLDWETATEVDNLGFNLHRAGSPGGVKVQINEQLIPSQAPGSPLGAAYDFADETVAPGVTYCYWLEAVDVYGRGQLFGPVQATAGMWQQVYLPLLVR